ncbi:hypothetical protein EMCRGX_G028405 [Ephydatia muelleri]
MEDRSSEVQAPTTPSNSRTPSGQAQVVRMSLRPPSRFSAGADLVLWRKRFELYARQAKIAEDQWTGELRLMRERPKTLNEALQLAGQYQGVEESQKRLHGASAKVETMAVGKEDDSESESEAVAAITNATRPSRLATQVEQLGKQIETLKLQLAATNNGRTYPRSRPNDAVSRKRSDDVVCWYCGKRGHIKRNCAKLKTSVETAAVGSCLSVDGRLANGEKLELVGQGEEAGAVLLEPLDTFMEDHGLLVARSLSQVSCNHLVVQVLNPGPAPVVVQVLNPGPAPVVVNKDVRVGVIKPVTDSDIVCSIESTKSNRHVGHSECAHLIELMLQNTEHLSSYHKSQGVALLQEFEDVIAKSDDDLGQTSLSFHTIDTGDNQPIRQHARRLPFHQHKEIWPVGIGKPYLYGRKFLLRTDHNSLCWLHNFKEPEGQVARWLETMAEFQYEVIHRPGKQHCNADSLSCGQCRQCGLEVELETDEMFPVCDIFLLPAWTNQEVADFQRADTDLEQVIYLVAVRISTPTMSKGFDLATPIPLDSVQKPAVERWHSLQTVGGYPRRKSPPRNKAPLEVSHASRPLERIAMDIMGPLPETPRDQGKNFEAKVIQEICHLLGVTKTRTTPYHPQSDGLVERFNRTLLEMLSTTVADEHDWDLSLPTQLLAYRTSVQETTGTTPFQLMFGRNPRLPEDVLYSLPVASHDSVTQYTRVLKGRLERSYQAVIKHVQQKQIHQKDLYDRGVRGSPYGVGDLVLLHSPAVPRGKSRKLHKPWQGPYRVGKAISPSVYRIVDCARPRCKRVVHFNRLKPAPLGNVPPAERVVNEEEHMEHSGDTAEEKEEEELEFTEMDQPVITLQDAVEINQ